MHMPYPKVAYNPGVSHKLIKDTEIIDSSAPLLLDPPGCRIDRLTIYNRTSHSVVCSVLIIYVFWYIHLVNTNRYITYNMLF